MRIAIAVSLGWRFAKLPGMPKHDSWWLVPKSEWERYTEEFQRSNVTTNRPSDWPQDWIGNIHGGKTALPDYPNDLNVVRSAVLQLFPNEVTQGFYNEKWGALMDNLKIATGHRPEHWNEHDLMTASAAQWSEAIVRTLGKYIES